MKSKTAIGATPKGENTKNSNRRDAETRKRKKTAIGMMPKRENAKICNRHDAER